MERPILFSTPMVQAILDGRKTQTRRMIFPHTDYTLFSQPTFEGLELDPSESLRHDKDGYVICDKISDEPKLYPLKGTWALFEGDQFYDDCAYVKCRFGNVGDILWVRETWQTLTAYESKPDYSVMGKRDFVYKADNDRIDKWRPSIFMPKEACRIRLEITNIRVEKLCDIIEEDAIMEGIDYNYSIKDGRSYVNYMEKFMGSFVCSCETARQSYMSLWDKINGRDSYKKNPWVWVIEF